MPDLFPAKTVTVARVWYACHADGCTFTGPNRATFADAEHNADSRDG